MSATACFLITCPDCGEDYPVNGDGGDQAPESAEHHADDCPMREVLEQRGQTADRDAHVAVEDAEVRR